jgi:hypothetical protein
MTVLVMKVSLDLYGSIMPKLPDLPSCTNVWFLWLGGKNWAAHLAPV